MTDASTSQGAVPDDADSPPSVEELERTAVDATYRRAPRLGRILGSGIAFSAGMGLVLGFSLPNATGVGRGMVALLLALGFGLIGGLTAGAIATRLDWPSTDAQTPKVDKPTKRFARAQPGKSAKSTGTRFVATSGDNVDGGDGGGGD